MLPDVYGLVMAPLLRGFLVMLGATTGVWMRFERLEGDFFQYRVRLEGVSLEVSKYLRCSAESCVLEFSILDAALDTLVISNLSLEGARFEYTHVRGEDIIPADLPPFLIKQVTLRDSEVVFTDQTRGHPLSFKLQIAEYHAQRVHSRSLLFDTLFTGTLSGQIEHAPLQTSYRREQQRGMTQWAIRDLPVRRVSRFVKGQLALLEHCTLDLLISAEWQADQEHLQLAVQVWMRDLLKFAPTPLLAPQGLSTALNNLVNARIQTLPIAFQFSLPRQDVLRLTRLDAFQILTAFSEALSNAILAQSQKNLTQIQDLGRVGLQTLLDLKQIFDKY